MQSVHYIGFDVHKKMIAYCIKKVDGQIVQQGQVSTHRKDLRQWIDAQTLPWLGAMEATMFTGWIYDFLKPHAVELKVAHPEMLKAITAAKKKNDQADAEKLADLLRVNLLPECTMLPQEIRDLRRVLRYRNLMVRTAVQMKNKVSGLLMEVGVPYDKMRLHGKHYFNQLMGQLEDVPDSVVELLNLSRSNIEMFQSVQGKLLKALKENDQIRERVKLLMSIPGVGQVLALTWILEIGDPSRFRSARQAVSYCGLCSAQRSSAGKEVRGPISKKRNKHLQHILIEAAKLAPYRNEKLAALYDKELAKGNRNKATLAIARKLLEHLLAVDKRGTPFTVDSPIQAI